MNNNTSLINGSVFKYGQYNEQGVYYVDVFGLDGVNHSGSVSDPFGTLAYAASVAINPGDKIILKPGNHILDNTVDVMEGVSIIGSGSNNTFLIATTAVDPGLCLSSLVEGTDGNQTLKDFTMLGNLTGVRAVLIEHRSNVKVHDCEFYDFLDTGVEFRGCAAVPVTYAENNELIKCIIINCAGTYVGNGGCLKIGGQSNMKILNSTIIKPDRGDDGSFPIKHSGIGYCRGIEIGYCEISMYPKNAATQWEFAIEFWNSRGGIHIHNNTIRGTLDFGCNGAYLNNDEFGYGYLAKVYNNNFGQGLRSVHGNVRGIDFERNISGGVYVYKNYFNYVPIGIGFSPANGNVIENVFIYQNIFNNVCNLTNNAFGCQIASGATTATWDNINIIGNTIIAETTGIDPLDGIRINMTTANNVNIINNIITGFSNRCIYFLAGTIDYIHIDNNLRFDNGGANAIDYTLATLNFLTEANNLIGDPLFVAANDFRLGVGSPGLKTGRKIFGIDFDFNNSFIEDLPNIGAIDN